MTGIANEFVAAAAIHPSSMRLSTWRSTRHAPPALLRRAAVLSWIRALALFRFGGSYGKAPFFVAAVYGFSGVKRRFARGAKL